MINLITQANEKYNKWRRLKFCGTVDCGLGEYVLYMFTVCKASIKCPGICHELCVYDAPDMRTIRAWITNTSSTLKKVKNV